MRFISPSLKSCKYWQSLQVHQEFSVQLEEMPSRFFQHLKSKPPYTEKYITKEAIYNHILTGVDSYTSVFRTMAERELELASANSFSPVTVLGVYSVEVTSLKSLVSPSRGGWQTIGSAVVSYSRPTQSL